MWFKIIDTYKTIVAPHKTALNIHHVQSGIGQICDVAAQPSFTRDVIKYCGVFRALYGVYDVKVIFVVGLKSRHHGRYQLNVVHDCVRVGQ